MQQFGRKSPVASLRASKCVIDRTCGACVAEGIFLMLDDRCLSAIDAVAAARVAEEVVLTGAAPEEFGDTVNHGFSDAVRVRKARAEEIKWVRLVRPSAAK